MVPVPAGAQEDEYHGSSLEISPLAVGALALLGLAWVWHRTHPSGPTGPVKRKGTEGAMFHEARIEERTFLGAIPPTVPPEAKTARTRMELPEDFLAYFKRSSLEDRAQA